MCSFAIIMAVLPFSCHAGLQYVLQTSACCLSGGLLQDAKVCTRRDCCHSHTHCRALSLAEAGGVSSSGYDSEGTQAQDISAAEPGPPMATPAEAAASTAGGFSEPPAATLNGSAHDGDGPAASGVAELAPRARDAAAEDAAAQSGQGSGTLQQSPAALPGVLETGQADADSAAAAALPGGTEVSLQHRRTASLFSIGYNSGCMLSAMTRHDCWTQVDLVQSILLTAGALHCLRHAGARCCHRSSAAASASCCPARFTGASRRG